MPAEGMDFVLSLLSSNQEGCPPVDFPAHSHFPWFEHFLCRVSFVVSLEQVTDAPLGSRTGAGAGRGTQTGPSCLKHLWMPLRPVLTDKGLVE